MLDDLMTYKAKHKSNTKILSQLLNEHPSESYTVNDLKREINPPITSEFAKSIYNLGKGMDRSFDAKVGDFERLLYNRLGKEQYKLGVEAGIQEAVETYKPQVEELIEKGKEIIDIQKDKITHEKMKVSMLQDQIASGLFGREDMKRMNEEIRTTYDYIKELKQGKKKLEEEYEKKEKQVMSGKSNEEVVKEVYKEELNEYGKDLMEMALDAGIQRSKLEGQPNIAGVIDYAIDTNNRKLEIRQSQKVKDALLRQNSELAMLQRSDVYKKYQIRYAHLKKYEPEHMMKYKEPEMIPVKAPISQEPTGKEKLETKEGLEMEQRKFDEEIGNLADIRTVNPSDMNALLQREKAINAKINQYRDTINPDQLNDLKNTLLKIGESLTAIQQEEYNKIVGEDISRMNEHDLDRFMKELKELREQADVLPESKLSKDISEKIKEVTDKFQKKQEKSKIKQNIAAKIESIANPESIKNSSYGTLLERADELTQLDKEHGTAIKGELHEKFKKASNAIIEELAHKQMLEQLEDERLEEEAKKKEEEEAKKKEEEEAKKKEEFEAKRKNERVVEAEIFKEAEAYRETLNKLRTIKFEQFANEPVKLMKEYVGLDFRKSPNQQLSMNMVETIEGHLDALLKDYVKEENVQKSYENQKILTTLSNIDEIPSHLSAKISKTLQTVSAKKLSSPRASPKKKTEPITKPTPKTKSKKKTGK